MSVRRNRYGVRKKSGVKKSDYFLNIRMVFQSAESRIPKFWTHFFSPPPPNQVYNQVLKPPRGWGVVGGLRIFLGLGR
jgi:hypothetical protein